MEKKRISIAIFGVGNVGATLIDQIIAYNKSVNHTVLEIRFIANSTVYHIPRGLLGTDWKTKFKKEAKTYQIDSILNFFKITAEEYIIVDATASATFTRQYNTFIRAGHHIATANKIANTLDINNYKGFRRLLEDKNAQFEYETNVGAGLPVIQIARSFAAAQDSVTKVAGVFSGSLSYIFNTFTKKDSFYDILIDAVDKGFTEPDPREDLSGKDVARKLLILSRELGLDLNLEDVSIESLIPSQLQQVSLNQFYNEKKSINQFYNEKLSNLKSGQVLRYVGTIDTLSKKLNVRLLFVDNTDALAGLSHTDNLVCFYTEGYSENPLVIKGAGAGAVVTARGLLNDIVKITSNIQEKKADNIQAVFQLN